VLRRLPGLMDAVRGAVARESVQLLDKLAYVVSKVRGRCLATLNPNPEP